jgi:ubiquitin fusion degradation protein 1
MQKGDKILLPPSAFDTLARLQVDYPMLFQLSSETKGTMTHSGVLEFTAEEGACYIPFWMMQNLLIEEGTVITVTNISLPKATFVKLQPQHQDFLEISNPRAVLEHALRNFSCVTKGDVIQVPYNGKNYHFLLKDVQPKDAACIIETDCHVDFDAPVGYKEPERYGTSTTNGSASAAASLPFGSSSTLPMNKQSAYQDRSSSCPFPAMSSTSGISDGRKDDDGVMTSSSSIRIVDGQIVRPSQTELEAPPSHAMLADKIGATGIQRNAAIPVHAPKVDYWAIQAGDGARLDGKQPSVLKDKDGTELDIATIRADAAAKRAAAAAAAANAEDGPVSKRKSKVGGKYSKLKPKAAAFQGSANTMT